MKQTTKTPIDRALASPLGCTLACALALALPSSGATRMRLEDSIAMMPGPSSNQPLSRHAEGGRLQNRLRSPNGGATIPFTNCNDSGPGSLRDAIAAAVDRDFVIYTPELTCSTITLTTGEITIAADNLEILGPGAVQLKVTSEGHGRVFRHSGAGLLRLYGMTIADGYLSHPAAGSNEVRGGCIFSNGTLMLGSTNRVSTVAYSVFVENCTAVADEAGTTAKGGGVFAVEGLEMYRSRVSGSKAIARAPAFYARGGAVYSAGAFSMTYSEVSGNRAYGGASVSRAGGVDAAARGTSFVYQSAIVSNEADQWGGAILGSDSYGGPVIIGSTISGNTSDGEAGVYVYNYSTTHPAHIIASTITANRSTNAGATGGLVVYGSVEIASSIVSGNTSAGTPRDLELVTDAASGSNNLIGAFTGQAPPGDGLIQTNDPRLAPLANNLGLTPTHALLPDSPAIDTGTHTFGINLYLYYDQRGDGFPRIIGSSADIGAYERDPDVILRSGLD
jgi:hypothetical protein